VGICAHFDGLGAIFSLPVAAIPTVQETVVTTPVVSSSVATINEHEKPVLQNPIEPIVVHKEEQQ
jgi:hypothetical protein